MKKLIPFLFLLSIVGCFGIPRTPVSAPTTTGSIINKLPELLNNSISIIYPLMILGIVGGVIVTFLDYKRIGMAIVFGCIAGVIANIFFAQFAWVIALLGLLSVMFILALTGIGFFRRWKMKYDLMVSDELKKSPLDRDIRKSIESKIYSPYTLRKVNGNEGQ